LNLWYLFMLEKLAALAAAARLRAARANFQKMYREQKRLVLARLWDRRTGLFRDGLKPDGTLVNVHSVHTQTLAIMCGLQPKHQASMVARRLLPYLRGRKVPGALPSSYWVTYVYDVMRRLGYAADVVRHIRKMWAPMIPYGGTFETFVDRIGQSSASHAWAAHPIYHLVGTLGGVVQEDKAWRRVAFAPLVTLPEADRARVSVPTPRGLIRASWQRRGRQARVALWLPKGVTADVQLPGVRPTTATGRKRWTVQLPKPRNS
jgi:alpha-L-rhamnosidase